MDENDLSYMELAIKLAAHSVDEDDKKPHPRVGAVVVTKEGTLIEACRGMLDKGDHAEFIALEKKGRDKNLSDATLYTTLEPCTTRKHPKVPCVHRICQNGIQKVWIGMLDPNPDVYAKGLWILERNGVDVEFFPKNLRDQIKDLNEKFIKSFEPGIHLTKDYWSIGTVHDVTTMSKRTISSYLWGNGESSRPDEYSQFKRISKVRESGQFLSELEEAELLFPDFNDMLPGLSRLRLDENAPAVIIGVVIKTSFLIKNNSGSRQLLTPSTSEGELIQRKSDDYIMKYQTTFDNPEHLSLDAYGDAQVPVTVRIQGDFPERGLTNNDRFKLYLCISQGFVELMHDGISGLTFQYYLQDGTDVRKEFGLRIKGNQKIISSRFPFQKIEPIPVADFLKKWENVESWIRLHEED